MIDREKKNSTQMVRQAGPAVTDRTDRINELKPNKDGEKVYQVPGTYQVQHVNIFLALTIP